MRLGRLLGVFLALSTSCFAVYYGQTKSEVLSELGKPVSAITRSGREILIYPAGARLELEQGKVVVVQGMPVQEGPGQPIAAPVEEAKPKSDVEAEKGAQAEDDDDADEPVLTAEQQKAADEADSKEEKEWQEANAKARAEMEKAIGDLENIHEQGLKAPPPPEFNVVQFGTQLLVGWLLTLIALKIACKYWGAEVFGTGLMTVAAADVVVKAIVGFIGMKLLEMPMLFYADEAAGALAMVLILQRVSINRSLAQAVQITLTTKVFSIVVGSLLFVVILRAF